MEKNTLFKSRVQEMSIELKKIPSWYVLDVTIDVDIYLKVNI